LKPLPRPKGPIRVAFLVSEGFQMIDFAGPWEIFQDALDPKTDKPAFEVFTVSRTGAPIEASGGLKVTPDHSFGNAPAFHVLVIPAQGDMGPEVLAWVRKVSAHTDLTMSVCTGAFLLAKAGLLDGLPATTHHDFYDALAVEHPKIKVREKVRFVDVGQIATASGLSSGIDLALHVVARYFGAAAAERTAVFVEHMGHGWKDPQDTGDLFTRIERAQVGLKCPVCHMGLTGKAISTRYRGKSYYFCSDECRKTFLKQPGRFVER
jgi:transcriptional regulator GlxA family with amidase domain/YHS domain-containing protein